MKRSADPILRATVVLLLGATVVWLVRRRRAGRRLPAPAPAPLRRRIPEGKIFGEGTRDVVDQASWESFPASDPPAY